MDDIEAVLSQVMSDEFHTTLEDDSPYLVAKHLYELFNQCIHGNYTEVERLREKAKSQNAYIGSSMGQGDDSDSGDDDQVRNKKRVFLYRYTRCSSETCLIG